jgi:hypothetical protein
MPEPPIPEAEDENDVDANVLLGSHRGVVEGSDCECELNAGEIMVVCECSDWPEME